MRRRSNLLVLVGLACFVVGVAAVYLVTSDDGGNAAAGDDSVEVVVASDELAAGALGDELITGGMVELRRVARADLQPDALTTQSQLSNTILTLNFAEGEQLRVSGLRPRSLLSSRVEIPEGHEAVAVQVGFTAGGAGYIAPGDRVNIFMFAQSTTVQPGRDALEDPAAALPADSFPRAELLLTNVTVLDVSQEVAPLRGSETQAAAAGEPAPARAGGDALVVLVAVNTLDAEKLVFTSQAAGHQVYLTRVRDDAPPAGPTDGRDSASVLEQEANDAFAASNPTP